MDYILTVHAKHVEETPAIKVYREFSNRYTLPNTIDPLTLNSTFAADGILSVEAPAPGASEAPRVRILLTIRLLHPEIETVFFVTHIGSSLFSDIFPATESN